MKWSRLVQLEIVRQKRNQQQQEYESYFDAVKDRNRRFVAIPGLHQLSNRRTDLVRRSWH
jgi:hypothetical protein